LVQAPSAVAVSAEAERICKYANHYGESRVFEILKGQKPGKGIADAVHGSIAESSFKAGKEAYKHLFLPQKNWRGTKGTGWHLPRNYPELITRVTGPPNKHGIYEARWKAPGAMLEKGSTCGPDNWNRVDFMKYARQAYSCLRKVEPQNNGRIKLTGIDPKGLKWEFIVERKSFFDELFTAYPLYE